MPSYFLSKEFTPQSLSPTSEGNYPVTGESFSITAGKITKDVTDFTTVTKQVIANLEGGYFNPKTHATGDSRYAYSGETMFGIDRKAGAPATAGPENPAAPASSKSFWKKIDDAQKSVKWSWNYIPPDPLQTELLTLAASIMKPAYTNFKATYLTNLELVKIVESDGRLLFNLIYATWNGPGWFSAFSKELTAYYNKGNKSADALLKWFVARRIDPTGLQIAGNYKVKRNDVAWSLSNQGGLKIKTLVGVS